MCGLGMLVLVPLALGAAEMKPLFGFEKPDVARYAQFEVDTPDAYRIHNSFGGETGEATEGRWALVRVLADRYGFLKPDNKSSCYIRHRTGCFLNTFGWFRKAMPSDWSGFDTFRLDVKSDPLAAQVRLELEDDFIAEPIVRQYAVPGGKWVTLEVDLARAARERGLDLKAMASLQLTVTEMNGRESVLRVDHLRLVKAGAADARPVLRDLASMAAPERRPGPVTDLPPIDLSRQTPPTGKIGLVDLAAAATWRKPDYPLFMAKERLLGGFGASGVILVYGASRAYLSLDGAVTWRGLDGRPEPTTLLTDIRSHRATVLVDGRDVFIACIPDHCAGGGGRTELHFTRALCRDGRWSVGPRTVIETGIRQCADRLSIVRLKTGRLWLAWDHLNRRAAYAIHAKYSDDGGVTWLDAGENGRVGALEGGGIPAGPYLAEWDGTVACVWRHLEALRWSRFDGKRWTEQSVVQKAGTPVSTVALGGDFYVAIARPEAVLRFDGKTWTDDSPPIKTGLLSRWGDGLAVVGLDPRDTGAAVVMCRKPAGGPWDPPVTIATEPEKIEGLAVPQVAPAAFLPVAWSDTTRRWIKVLAVRRD